MIREPKNSIGNQAKSLTDKEVSEILSPFTFKTKNLKHQDRALICALDNDGFLFSLGMGLGKTKLGLDIQSIFTQEKGCVQRMLVLCPAVVVQEWAIECEKHSYSSIALVSGTKKQKLDTLHTNSSDIVVASFSWIRTLLVSSRKDPYVRQVLRNISSMFDILIIDESHSIQNPHSQGFKLLQKYFMDIPKRYLMTGTPVGNNWTAVWSQYYIIDKGKTYGKKYSQFLKTYFDSIETNFPKPIYKPKTHKIKIFSRLFWRKNIRYADSDCPDLPSQIYKTFYVNMNNSQAKSYAKELLKISYESYDKPVNPNKLMRITGGCDFEKSPKLEQLLEIIEFVCVQNQRQVIVWHWLIEEGRMIQKSLSDKYSFLNPRSIRGETTDRQKLTYLEEWRKGDCKILIANPRSLGIGVNLKESNVAIFYSNTPSLLDRKQAEKRIHRTGQKNNCIYIDLICRETIDETILQRLGEKHRDFVLLTRDDIKNVKK